MRISQASHNLMRQTILVLDTLHPQHGSSSSGHRYIDRDREASHLQLMKYYFFDINSTYNEDLFRRCYRITRKNATGKWGASPHQKMTPVMRMLAYCIPTDAADEYSRLGEKVERPNDPIDESNDESDPDDRLRRAVSRYDGVEETASSQSVLTLEEMFAHQDLIWSSTIHARLKHDPMEHVWNLFGETNNNL
ncbi:hypothetical protein Ddye_024287 [Dipteronia dyeriana]|uniref:Uncharacterized protein n=1 Tax=Dipteronia dyeriana TaxID=168575 RepID=A0AAD9WST8_9ROSI|nr:hypothetical protein Ddye_024287 [Dipteronia dyeriana]